MMKAQTLNIVLIEDDAIDAEAVSRAFGKRRIANPIHVLKDGNAALDFLREFKNTSEQPFVILLDLNLPGMNGVDFLQELRRDRKLRSSIVFVLSTSQSNDDMMETYKYNIAGYIIKSSMEEDLLGIVNFFESYWRCVEFPSSGMNRQTTPPVT